MKNRFDLLVFDWDGTLFDSVGWIVDCLKHASREVGLPEPSDALARSVIGLSLPQAMHNLFPGLVDEELKARLVQSYRTHYHTCSSDSLGLFDGVEEMLKELKASGFSLAVATGKARSGLNHALKETGMEDFFHTTRCADETKSKPHPLMVLEIMGEIGVSNDRTLLIGDSLHDLNLAINAGVASVAVTCGANSMEELLELNPLACLESTAELIHLLS